MEVITVEEFEKAVKTFGFNSPVVTAIWNSMFNDEDNQDEFEIIYAKWACGYYKDTVNKQRRTPTMTDTLKDQQDFIEAIEDYIKALTLITTPESPQANIIKDINDIITQAKQELESQLYY